MRAAFDFGLHENDLPLLLAIQKYFKGVGNIITDSKKKVVYFQVRNLEALTNVIIPHFNTYPLLTNKRKDFIL